MQISWPQEQPVSSWAAGDRCNRLSKLLGFGGTCSLLKILPTLDESPSSFFFSSLLFFRWRGSLRAPL